MRGRAEAKTWIDRDHGYSFQYPGDWEIQANGGVVATDDTHSEGSAGVAGDAASEGRVQVYDPHGAVAGGYYVDCFQIAAYGLDVTITQAMMPEVRKEVCRLLTDLEEKNPSWQRVEDLADVTVSGLPGYQITYSLILDGVPIRSALYFVFTGDVQYQLTLEAAVDNWRRKQADFNVIMSSLQLGTIR